MKKYKLITVSQIFTQKALVERANKLPTISININFFILVLD